MSHQITKARISMMMAILFAIVSSLSDGSLHWAAAEETISTSDKKNEIELTIKDLLPEARVKITIVKSLAVLSGTVNANEDLLLLHEVASQYFPNVFSQVKVADSIRPPKQPTHTEEGGTNEPRRNRSRGSAPSHDPKRLLDEVRGMRQDLERLTDLVELKLAKPSPAPTQEPIRTPFDVKLPSNSLLFFTAKWCGPCQQMQPIVDRLKRLCFPIHAIDIDENPKVAKAFNVQTLPQCILLVDGVQVDQVTGVTTEDRLRGMLKKLNPDPTPEQKRLQAEMSKRLSFERGAMPLEQALDNLRQHVDLNVWLDTQGFEEAGVPRNSLVNKIAVKDVSCQTVLQLMLEPLGLTFIVDREVIRITSRQRALGDLTTAVYPVDDILKWQPTQTSEELTQLIVNTISPDSWDQTGGPGSLRYSEPGRSVVVRQALPVHVEIAALLQQLRTVHQSDVEKTKQAQAQPTGIVPVQFTTEAATKLQPDEPVVVTYAVADLVIPNPGIDREGETGIAMKWLALIDKIKGTISPTAWDKNGLRCSITSHKPTFSLVIRATTRMHEQIAELLPAMRREDDEQICMEVHILKFSDDPVIHKSGLKFAFDEKTRAAKPTWQEADKLIKAVDAQNSGRRIAPKITIFDGQIGELGPDFFREGNAGIDDLDLYVRGKVTTDSRHVRLNLAVNPKDLVEDLTRHSLQVANDGFVLFDMTEAMNRDKPANPQERFWVLLKPRIIIMDDEEETATSATVK